MIYTSDMGKYVAHLINEPFGPRILIEGDSWTDHPLVSNMAWLLYKFLRQEGFRPNVLNVSSIGDLVFEMSTGKQLKKLQSLLKSNRLKFDVMLLSGGGNDILLNEEQPEIGLGAIVKEGKGDDPQSYINNDVFSKALLQIEESYHRILSEVANESPSTQVFSHTYDNIYPRDNGTDILVKKDVIGHWVWPVMKDKGIDDQVLMRNIVKVLLQKFAELMKQLESEYEQFNVVETRETLPELASWPKNIQFWDDEIHPDSRGFARLVYQKVGPAVVSALGDFV